MTDQGLIEDRLRRTFDAVADRAVASAGGGNGPSRSPSTRARPGRRLLVGAVVVAVVAATFAFALAYGPRSSNPPSPGRTPTAGQPPAGARASLRLVYRPVSPVSLKARRQIASIMDARLRSLSGRNIKVSVTGGDIDVSALVPGRLVTRARSLVGDAAVVSFRSVDCLAPSYSPGPNPDRPGALPACGAAYLINGTETHSPDVVFPPDPAFTTYRSTTPTQADDDPATTVLLPADPVSHLRGRFVLGPTELSGSDISGATGHGVRGLWSINLDFTTPGATRLDQFEHENFHQTISVDLDGAVLALASIDPYQAAFTSAQGKFTFGGDFSAGQARDLVVLLNHGSLPVRVKLISSTTVGAGLHQGP